MEIIFRVTGEFGPEFLAANQIKPWANLRGILSEEVWVFGKPCGIEHSLWDEIIAPIIAVMPAEKVHLIN